MIGIYTLPEDGKTWAECKVGDVTDSISFEYERYFNGVGTFTLEIPINSRFRGEIGVNSVLVTADGDALMVRNIQTTVDKAKITGYDLNGLLYDRVTLSDETSADGSDAFSGTTEACVKHYVAANLCESSVTERNLPRFAVAPDLGRGTADDHALPRLQNVGELVTELCGAAGLGWRVSVDLSAGVGRTNPVFVFDVAAQVDRSAGQDENPRVIFSEGLRNIFEMTREVGVTSAKNALYCDINGTVVQYPAAGQTEGRTAGAGYSRREEYCALSGESLDPDVYGVEAEHNMADRMEETDSLTIDAGSPLDYRALYDVGDIVTVYDAGRALQLDSVISAAKIRRTATEYSVKLTLGESKPKLLDGYAKKNEATLRTVRTEQGSAAANPTAPLTEYAVTSDSVVKYNGVTYTAEFAEGGAIAKISDDKGGAFEPTFAAGVTNIALHNAVFWAVAMARGLKRPAAADALTKMCAYRYNCDSMAQNGANITWRNQAAGGNVDCTFSGAALNGDGVFVQGSAASQGIIPYVATNSAMPRTIYIVARNASANSLRTLTTPGAGSWGTSVLLGGANSVWNVYGQINTTGLATSASSLQKTVICIAIDAAAQVKVYINGEYAGSAPATAPQMTSGSVQLGGVSSYYDGGGYYYYDVAIADELHEEADIAANSAYLAQKYNVQ